MKLFKSLTALSALLLAIIGTISCTSETVQISEDEVGKWEASRPMGYKTFDELFLDKDMDMIAIGTIDKIVEITELDESERVKTYRTAFSFRIEKLFMGEDTKEVIVYQMGSPEEPSSGFSDDPMFRIGEKSLLFLKKNVHGSYFTIGAEGRYKIVDDKVFSLNYVLPNGMLTIPETMDFNGVTVKQIIEDVTERLDEISATNKS
jgi:hypothetical protein